MTLRLPRRAALLAAALCALSAPILTGAFELSASERVAAERIAELAQTDEGRATLQQLLSTTALDRDTQPLSGVGRGTLKSEAYGEEEGEELLEEDLTGVQSKQGAGFKIAFYPKNSTVFDPMKSKSFRVVPKQMFLLGYADNTHLKGFQSRDVVQLGDFFVDTKFGSITDCNSPDFNNVDGILGFGMPVQHQAAPPPPSGLGAMMGGGGGGGAPPVVLPLPLLFGLTDPTIKNSENNHVLSRRAFSFMSTDTAAEIQLGGYDPASVDGRMFLTPSITMNDYVVVSLSLKFGDVELLDFLPKNPRLRYLPAIMDSGTSCLVIPDNTMGGLLKESPYAKWKAIVKDTHKPAKKDTFHLNIAGAVFDIDYSDWWLTLSNQSCVQKAPEGFGGILIGDVLFRRYLVLFDLRHYPETVVIGIGKQSASYVPAKHHATIAKVPAYKRKPLNISAEAAPPRYKAPMATDRIPIWNQEDTQYFINISIGNPRQKFTVIFDTGSSVFGIFTKCIPTAPSYGSCTFGGGASGGSGMLVEGAVMVMSGAACMCIFGIFINIWFRKRQDKQEREITRKTKNKNPSNSSYGPERLAGMYGATS